MRILGDRKERGKKEDAKQTPAHNWRLKLSSCLSQESYSDKELTDLKFTVREVAILYMYS